MLTELRIRNFAIIEEVGLEFSDGFIVLTGETGAGKSILVDALDLLVGGRASTDLIRTGADEAEVSGVFMLDAREPTVALLKEQDLLGPDIAQLILRRILSRSGRHRIYVNGHPAPLSLLQSLKGLLVDIHGQHDQQSLFKPAVHLDLLDGYGDLAAIRTDYIAAFNVWRELDARIVEREKTGAERRALEESLRYQSDEIAAADLRAGEDAELEREHLLLSQGQRLTELAHAIYGPLYEEESSILDKLHSLAIPLKELSGIDNEMTPDRERFEEAASQLSDLAHRVRDYRDGLGYDSGRLEVIEERLDLLRKLMKKYGGSLEEVRRRGEAAAQQLRELEDAGASLAELGTQVKGARAEAAKLAQTLSDRRTKTAADLEKRLEKELAALYMQQAHVRISLHQNAAAGSALTPTGIDQVEFLFSANMGEVPQPLARIASGGELSRVMLALKTVLARVDRVPVLVFDEVDAGIGGAVAEVVGKRLRHLSTHGHQVFCITHLAPIAVQAERHFVVTKNTKAGRTVTQVAPLNTAGRVEEVARMLGGATITTKIRETAAEMLRAAHR